MVDKDVFCIFATSKRFSSYGGLLRHLQSHPPGDAFPILASDEVLLRRGRRNRWEQLTFLLTFNLILKP